MGPIIKPKFRFFQEPVERLGENTVIFAQHPFSLTPEILNPIDMIGALGKDSGVIDPGMLEFWDISGVVWTLAIGVHNAIRLNSTANNWHPGVHARVRNLGREFPTPLHNAKQRNFPAAPRPR